MKRLTFMLFGASLIAMTLLPACNKDKGIDKASESNKEQLAQSEKQLKQMAFACSAFTDSHGRHPADSEVNGKRLLSWRVALLPYFEQMELYDQFDLTKPWDDPHNLKLLDKMPAVYKTIGVEAKVGHTHYRGFRNGLFRGSGITVQFAGDYELAKWPGATGLFIEGAKNETLLIATLQNSIPWTKPDELTYDGKEPSPLGYFYNGKAHGVMLNVTFVEISPNVSPKTLLDAIKPSDDISLGKDWPNGS
jgi:hypothetical protein